MDYVARTGQVLSPERKIQAEQYIKMGYQKLLTFERPGGGFDWWGRDPALVYLTAYGIQEFGDMRRILPDADYGVVDRARAFLMSRQEANGTWADPGGTHGERISAFKDPQLPLTAYVTWSMLIGGMEKTDERIQKALAFLRGRHVQSDDAYTLAVCANALLSADPKDDAGLKILTRLSGMKVQEGRKAFWKSNGSVVTHATGASADVETTALIVLAHLRANREMSLVNQALEWIVSVKDPRGTWGTTQATVLALKALLDAAPGSAREINAEISIQCNGKSAGAFVVTPKNSDVLQQANLKPFLAKGANTVEILYQGEGTMMYQIVGRYSLPWGGDRAGRVDPYVITVDYDRTQLAARDLVTATVKARNNQSVNARMVMLDLGIPPGFSVQSADLDKLVEEQSIVKYTLTARQVTIYLDALEANSTHTIAYRLQAKYPVKARSQASRVYEYYAPEKESFAAPVGFEVRE